MWKGVWDANKKSLTLEIILKAVLLAENLEILSGTFGGVVEKLDSALHSILNKFTNTHTLPIPVRDKDKRKLFAQLYCKNWFLFMKFYLLCFPFMYLLLI